MRQRRSVPDQGSDHGGRHTQEPADASLDQAFSQWLSQSLHLLFGPIADEPLPEDLLRLIDADRTGSDSKS